jgi:hypothetical protein
VAAGITAAGTISSHTDNLDQETFPGQHQAVSYVRQPVDDQHIKNSTLSLMMIAWNR